VQALLVTQIAQVYLQGIKTVPSNCWKICIS